MYRFRLYLLLYMTACQVGFAQSNDFRFDHLSTEQGLSQQNVTTICQDRDGFMWFGTSDGLNKYDGYRFTVFKPDPLDPTHSLRHNIISAIHEDRQGRLWVGTLGGGLHLINKRTGIVTAYPINPTAKIAWNVIGSIYEDPKGIIWVGSTGLARFNPDTKQYTLFPYLFTGDIFGDKRGRIWFCTATAVHRFSPATGTYTSFPMPSSESTTFYLDRAGILWLGTRADGIFRADTQGDSLRLTRYTPHPVLNKVVCTSLYQAPDGLLWMATTSGLLRINSKTNEVVEIPSAPWRSDGLGEITRHQQLVSDRAGNLWVPGYNGVYKLKAHPKPFRTYQLESTPTSVRLSKNAVTSLLEDHTGSIWATNANQFGNFKYSYSNWEFYRTDSSGQKTTRLYIRPDSPRSYSSNAVRGLYEDHRGRIWATTTEGLHQYNPSTGLFIHYLSTQPLGIIKEDATGKLWISIPSNSNGGIVSFNPTTHQFRYYLTNPKNVIELQGRSVFNLIVSRNNTVWIAFAGDGLAKLDQQTDTFTYYPASPTFRPGYLNDKDLRALYEDSQGFIWVGTNQGGLHRFNPKTGRFRLFSAHDGLPSNHIDSIEGDDRGNLWISTDNGLCRFNPKTNTFRNFDRSDGLTDNEFLKGASQKRNGRLLFGTANGYVIFHPDSIRDNRLIPPVYITQLKILDKPRPLLSDHVELPYAENYLSFEFVALNYDAPEKNQYAYQLEGIDKDWVYSGPRRFTSYTELSPGEYTFRVKASNNDGIWNEKGTILSITIWPPWWHTWWAYLLYAVAFLASLRAYIVYRSRALRRENRLLEEKVGLRTKQLEHKSNELEQSLTNLRATQTQLIQREKMASLGELTAGIAHEIQNPLNFVNNFAEVSVELAEELEQSVDAGQMTLTKELASDLRQNMHHIAQNGQRASNIVKGMLEHSRTSTGEHQPTDLNALCDEYLRLAYQGIRAKDNSFNCQLETHFDPDLPPVEVVASDMSRVLLNLFNNAFYAVGQKQKTAPTDYQPTVWVSTRLVAHSSPERAVAIANPNGIGGLIEIRVRDNGMGIPDAIKEKIFQPFFTTKPTGEGTGLGLSLSYDIVTKGHGGMIEVESTEGQETQFTITLPFLN